MRLAIIYSGKHSEKVESIAKELGGTFTRQPKAGKEVLNITVKDGDEFSVNGPFREYEEVPIGFVEGLTQNLKVKWGRDLKVTNEEEITVTVSSENDLEVLSWTLWCYLEALADKKIGRLWL